MKIFCTNICLSLLFVVGFFVSSTSSVLAGCIAVSAAGGVCNAPNSQCTLDGTVFCCGDTVNQSVGAAECTALTGSSTAGTGGDSQSFSQLTGNLNGIIFGENLNHNLSTPRGIISALLPLLFILGGMILFVMIVWGGFEMLTGAANPKSQEAGKQRITAAVIGFILLFASFWLAQLLELIFGISIL